MAEKSEPQVIEITVHYHGGGKVAIEEFGKEATDYGVSFSRKYAIPPDWTEAQVAEFELDRTLDLKDQAEPLLQQERDDRMAQRRF